MGAVSGGWLIGTDAVIRAETGRAVAAQFACAEDNIAHEAPVRQIACCCCEGWLLAAQRI